jgi:hypothetical protein
MERVSINLVSQKKLSDLTTHEKIRLIIEGVKAGKVMILEMGLTPSEETELIESTMAEVDHESFIGIEMDTYNVPEDDSWLSKLFRRKWLNKGRWTVIGPANRVRMLKKDPGIFEAIITVEGRG